MTDPVNWPLVEPTTAPEILIDGFQGGFATNGVLKLNFFSLVPNLLTGEPEKRIVLRLAGSIATLADVHSALGPILEQIMQEASNGRPN